jgi:hypothetical protein
MNESRGGAFFSQECPDLAGQFSRAAEQAIQDQGAPDVTVQAVFGCESDPAQDLLAVTGRRQRSVARPRGYQKPRGCHSP